jgi:hypothetical protein
MGILTHTTTQMILRTLCWGKSSKKTIQYDYLNYPASTPPRLVTFMGIHGQKAGWLPGAGGQGGRASVFKGR